VHQLPIERENEIDQPRVVGFRIGIGE